MDRTGAGVLSFVSGSAAMNGLTEGCLGKRLMVCLEGVEKTAGVSVTVTGENCRLNPDGVAEPNLTGPRDAVGLGEAVTGPGETVARLWMATTAGSARSGMFESCDSSSLLSSGLYASVVVVVVVLFGRMRRLVNGVCLTLDVTVVSGIHPFPLTFATLQWTSKTFFAVAPVSPSVLGGSVLDSGRNLLLSVRMVFLLGGAVVVGASVVVVVVKILFLLFSINS